MRLELSIKIKYGKLVEQLKETLGKRILLQKKLNLKQNERIQSFPYSNWGL